MESAPESNNDFAPEDFQPDLGDADEVDTATKHQSEEESDNSESKSEKSNKSGAEELVTDNSSTVDQGKIPDDTREKVKISKKKKKVLIDDESGNSNPIPEGELPDAPLKPPDRDAISLTDDTAKDIAAAEEKIDTTDEQEKQSEGEAMQTMESASEPKQGELPNTKLKSPDAVSPSTLADNSTRNVTVKKGDADASDKHDGQQSKREATEMVESASTEPKQDELPDTESRPVIEDPQPVKSSAEDEVVEETIEAEIDPLETINHKRQEEKEIFQKLIDDVTRLEHELSNKQTACYELQMKLDVSSIELDEQKENNEEKKNKINELEQSLSEAQVSITAYKRAEEAAKAAEIDSSSTAYMNNTSAAAAISSHHETDQTALEEEIKDLHQKIRHLTHDDELRVQRIALLETEISQFNQLMSRVEGDIGKERLESLQQNKNGVAHNLDQSKSFVRGNEVSADLKQSAVCVIV